MMRWNCQTALALAEFDAQGGSYERIKDANAEVKLQVEHLETVSSAYLKELYSKDADRRLNAIGFRARYPDIHQHPATAATGIATTMKPELSPATDPACTPASTDNQTYPPVSPAQIPPALLLCTATCPNAKAFDLYPACIGYGNIIGPTVNVYMLLGVVIGWGILSPVAKNNGWAPGPVGDWEKGSRGWILWAGMGLSWTGVWPLLSLLSHTRRTLSRRLRRHYETTEEQAPLILDDPDPHAQVLACTENGGFARPALAPVLVSLTRRMTTGPTCLLSRPCSCSGRHPVLLLCFWYLCQSHSRTWFPCWRLSPRQPSSDSEGSTSTSSL